jgi:hypothetical protein
MEFSRVLEIELKNGQVVHLQLTEAFIDKVRKSLLLTTEEQITERHIKAFLVSSMQRALEV